MYIRLHGVDFRSLRYDSTIDVRCCFYGYLKLHASLKLKIYMQSYSGTGMCICFGIDALAHAYVHVFDLISSYERMQVKLFAVFAFWEAHSRHAGELSVFVFANKATAHVEANHQRL